MFKCYKSFKVPSNVYPIILKYIDISIPRINCHILSTKSDSNTKN